MNRLLDEENSAEPGSFGRRGLLLALTGTLVLPACGWKPLYERPGPSVNSGGAGTALAEIWIDPVEAQEGPNALGRSMDTVYNSRSAQLLQNYLKEALNPYGPPNPPRYRLAVQLSQQTHSSASLGDGTTTREDLVMAADFQLRDPSKVKNTNSKAPTTTTDPETLKKLKKEEDAANGVLLRDLARIVTSYDILREPYADLTSRRDAQQRAAQQIAEAIQTRLAAFLVQ
jgi:LPS-assembly lipoprotein